MSVLPPPPPPARRPPPPVGKGGSETESSSLPTARLRGSDAELPRLVLGTWGILTDAYGGALADDDAKALIRAAWDEGIRAFDLAALWSAPHAAGLLRDALGDDAKEAAIFLRAGRSLSALGRPRMDFGAAKLRDTIRSVCDASSVERVQGLMLHAPTEALLERDDSLRGLREIVSEGLASSIGISTPSGAVATLALERGIDFVTLPYNAVQTHIVRELDESFPPAEGEEATCVMAHTILLHGVLAAKVPGGHVYPPEDHRRDRWTEAALRERLRHARALDACLKGAGAEDRVDLALRFALTHPRIGLVTIGPRTKEQLAQLCRYARAAESLSEGAQREIESRLMVAGA